MKSDTTGFQFLDYKNTSNYKNPANDAKLTQYTADTPIQRMVEKALNTTLMQKEKTGS